MEKYLEKIILVDPISKRIALINQGLVPLAYFDDMTDAFQLFLKERAKDHFETERQFKQSGPLFNRFAVFSIMTDTAQGFDESSNLAAMKLFYLVIFHVLDICLANLEQSFQKTFSERCNKEGNDTIYEMCER